MSRTDSYATVEAILRSVPYATIATVNGAGLPWLSPVVAFWDSKLVLYWASSPNSHHSRNLRHQSLIAVTVYDSSAPLGEGIGVYLRMQAVQITAAQNEHALTVYRDRFGEETCPTPFMGTCPRRIYQASPKGIWLNDGGSVSGHFIDVRRRLNERPTGA